MLFYWSHFFFLPPNVPVFFFFFLSSTYLIFFSFFLRASNSFSLFFQISTYPFLVCFCRLDLQFFHFFSSLVHCPHLCFTMPLHYTKLHSAVLYCRCVYALSGGVRRAHLLAPSKGALLKELYTRYGDYCATTCCTT